MAATTQSALSRCMNNITCEVEKFCCCSLRAGVLFASILYLVNASLALAGEAALYLGMLNALSHGLPPGTKLDDPKLHGGLIGIGIYMLIGAILGFITVCRRNVRAATGFFVLSCIDVVLATLVGVVSWFTGAPFNALLAQLPTLLMNVYMVIVVRSWRNQLIREQSGVKDGDGFPPGAAAVSQPGVTALGDDDELDIDADDLDLDLEAPAAAAAAVRSAPGRVAGGPSTGESKTGIPPGADRTPPRAKTTRDTD